ncbi:plasmid mobilization relaxosome protein MobC [Actinomadura sp. LOL_016]|uniref:plasmid mobilization protein n=1 Tax=unclassified Actinomadura TaxID=2626254 RepID=UPI003A7FCCDF
MRRRPRLDGGKRRAKELRIRVSDEEYQEIREAAADAGMACSAFVVKTVRTAIRERRPVDGALVALHGELRNASRQVNAVGVNLNQLARYANACGDLPDSLPWLAEYCFRVVRRAEAVIVLLGRRLP